MVHNNNLTYNKCGFHELGNSSGRESNVDGSTLCYSSPSFTQYMLSLGWQKGHKTTLEFGT